MLRTNAEFVSRVVNSVKAYTKDGHVSRRHILRIGQDKATFLISQKYDERTMYLQQDCVVYLNCFEMEEINPISCKEIEFLTCKRLMKSKVPLPQTANGKSGIGILSVTTVDGQTTFDFITPSKFMNIQKRRYYAGIGRYYTIKGGHLFLPNPKEEAEAVDVGLYALEEYEVAKLSGCDQYDKCKPYMDYNFICPDRLFESVVKDTSEEVIRTHVGIPEDANPNMDPNIKSRDTR